MKTIIFTALAVIIAACSNVNTESDMNLLITTEKQIYYVSDKLEAEVTFYNQLGMDISIHNAGCGFPDFFLERFEDDQWKNSGGPVCIALALPPTTVKNGMKFTSMVGMYLEEQTVSGIHRLKFSITEGCSQRLLESKYLYSNVFQIVKE